MAPERRTATTTTTRRTPSAAELRRAVETMEAAYEAERRTTRAQWLSEGVFGRTWRYVSTPRQGGLRDLYRHVLTPWYWALPAGGAIAAQEAVAAGASTGAASLGLVAAGATVSAHAVPRFLRSDRGRSRHPHAADWAAREPGHTRWAATVAAAGAVAAHAVGMSVGWSPDAALGAATAGLGAFTALGSRYWRHHREHTLVLNSSARKRVLARTDQGGGDDPAALVRRLQQRWGPYVAAANKPLPGSHLSQIQQTSYGATAILHLAEGSQEKSSVVAAMGRIATGLKLSATALAVEDIQAEDGAEPDSSILRLRVVSQATSARPVALDDGQARVVCRGRKVYARLGRYIDGQGEAEWLLYDGESMWGGFVAGKTGAGKTTILETLVMAALESGTTFVVYAKPRKGPSPRIAKHAHWTIESDAASRSAMIDGIVRLMEVRGLINELNDTSNFAASPEYPGVLVVLDEFHEVSAQIEQAGKGRLNRISREIRAVGGAMVGASQGFGLEGFSQDDVLRGNMTATNAVSMKLSATQAGIFKREMSMPVNPGSLPDPAKDDRNKGLSFSLLGRPVPFRSAWAPEDESEALMAAAAAKAVAGLDPESEAALDEGSRGLYSDRHNQGRRRKEEARKMLERMRSDMGMGAPSTQGQAPKQKRSYDHRAAARSGRPVPPVLPERVVLDLDAARKAKEQADQTGTGEAETPAPPTRAPRRSPAIEGVLEVLRSQGPVGTTAIREALSGREGCGKEAVDRALRTLSEEGAVAKAGTSRKAPWKLTV